MRKLLVVLAALFAFLPLAGSAQGLVDKQLLTFNLAVSQALFYERIVDSLPDTAFAVIDDQQDLNEWTLEIVPFFGYEGITGPDADEFTENILGGYVYPERIRFEYFDDRGSLGQHHILGMANCMSGDLWMNERFANPNSSFYQSKAVLEVLVHELAHIQGVCFDPELSEVSASIITLEVLASMAIKGNNAAFSSLMLALESMYKDAALAIALDEGRLAEYEYVFGLSGEIPGATAQERAGWDKTMRYWESDPGYLREILMKYNFVPMAMVQASLPTDSCFYTNPEWDKEKQDIVIRPYVLEGVPCINGVDLPVNMDVFTLPLVIDDLDYVMENAEALALEVVLENWPIP